MIILATRWVLGQVELIHLFAKLSVRVRPLIVRNVKLHLLMLVLLLASSEIVFLLNQLFQHCRKKRQGFGVGYFPSLKSNERFAHEYQLKIRRFFLIDSK